MNIKKISQSQENILDPKIFGFFGTAQKQGRIVWKEATTGWDKVDTESLLYRRFLGVVSSPTISSVIPTYQLFVSVSVKSFSPYTYEGATVSFSFNKLMSKAMNDLKDVAKWTFADNESVTNDLYDFLDTVFGLNITLPHTIAEQELEKMKSKTQAHVRLTRRKIPEIGLADARILDVHVEPKPNIIGHEIFYQITHVETGTRDTPKLIRNKEDDGTQLSASRAMEVLNLFIENAKKKRYVDDKSIEYIPPEATPENWDFDKNYWKNWQGTEQGKDVSETPSAIDENLAELLGNDNTRMTKVSQNFEGYFTGTVPEYATQFLGTTSVEASQIESMFGKAHEAVNMVNRFNSSLLMNISFIFNFAKSGAYGVYLSALDRAIKTKALAKKLEQQGYEIKTTGEGLTAFPKKDMDKTPEQIQRDIDTLYADLESKGGTAIGINMNSVLSASKQDAMEMQAVDPDVWQWIAVLHLGGTIVHEAIHAKGNMGEGPSGQGEQAFVKWALPQINEMYRKDLEAKGKGNEFSPLVVTNRQRHARSKNWYKTAQLSYYIPQSYMERPIGSDIQGRFPTGLHSDEGLSPWSMIAQQDQSISIEKRLSRQYMSPLPRDLSQEHDILEEQLRKYTRHDKQLDPKASIEELLSEGWDEDRAYTTIEGLLDEKRPKPLMVPLKKSSADDRMNKNAQSKVVKTATLFGWMNNLSISDGNTIPGLGDRVMAWDDRDEDFSQEEDWIKKQPRYNPTYDLKGFYYRWIEPRFQPQLYEDMTRDYGNTHPAKRFASSSMSVDPEVAHVIAILSVAKSKIVKKQIKSTRFIATEDVMPIIDSIFPDGSFKILVFHCGNIGEEDIFAVWISSPDISEELIERVEKHLQKKSVEKEIDKIADDLFSLPQQESIINDVIDVSKDVCNAYHFKDIICESSGRDGIVFAGGKYDQIVRMGSVMAEKLGVTGIRVGDNQLSFAHKGIVVYFNGTRENR